MKIAPLLVSGSWVTWLMNSLSSLLPARFRYDFLFNELTEEEATEMAYKYSEYFQVPIIEEVAYAIVQTTQGDPHYISALICSDSLKRIVIYLCKNKGLEVKRKKILEDLQLDLTEDELEMRLKDLVQADIIHQGQTNARYHSINDNLFDKVFRGAGAVRAMDGGTKT